MTERVNVMNMVQRTVRVTRNGQVTIPKAVRDQFMVKEGDMVAFEVKDGRVILHFVDPEPISPADAEAIKRGLEQLLRGEFIEYEEGMYRD